MTDPRITPAIFKQKTACSDCPFRREGAVNHGPSQMLTYASYFLMEPGATFPCHKSVPKTDKRERWSTWQDGQVICVGGLMMAAKHGVQNALVRYAVKAGIYDPASHAPEELATVVDTVAEMIMRPEEP